MRAERSPFSYEGDERGVLCVHGFTGSPFEMSYLGEALSGRGFSVVGPVLPGHQADVHALNDTTWRDWYAGLEREFDALRARCRCVAVAGLSMGGLLALELARRRGPSQLAALAVMSVPLWFHPLAQRTIDTWRRFGLQRLVPLLPKAGGESDVRDPVMRARNPGFAAVPTRAVLSLDELAKRVRSDLPLVRVPTLVLHGRRDHTAPYACSEYLQRHLGAPEVVHRALYGSYHLTPLDIERDVVAGEVGRFFERRLEAG